MEALNEQLVGEVVLVRARVHTVRAKGKSAFLVLRQRTSTVQVVFFVNDTTISKGMVKYVASLPKESIIDVEGTITTPEAPVDGCTQRMVEIAVRALAASIIRSRNRKHRVPETCLHPL